MKRSLHALALLMAGIGLLLQPVAAQSPAPARKILFLAGPRDHGALGRHEYERDLKTLAQSLEQSTNLKGVSTQLIVGSLPRDLAAVQDAAAIVIDSSSDRAEGETHPLFPPNPTTNGRGYDPDTTAWLRSLDDVIRQKQIGIVILHYATWAENWRARDYYLNWIGGLWVQIASKNPVDDWKIGIENRRHPILRGMQPWSYRDEI